MTVISLNTEKRTLITAVLSAGIVSTVAFFFFLLVNDKNKNMHVVRIIDRSQRSCPPRRIHRGEHKSFSCIYACHEMQFSY